MDNYDFEYFVAGLWEAMGWQTTVSQASVDAGIDVIAEKEKPYPQKKVIQAKRYSENTTVGGPDIQQYSSLKKQVDGADSVIIVTSSSFTSSARARANDLNVKLVAGDDIVEMIHRYGVEDLVDEYTDVKEVQEPAATLETQPVSHQPKQAEQDHQTEPTTESTASRIDTGDTSRWHYAAAGTTALTYLTVGVSDLVFFLFWIGSVVTLYLDIRQVRERSNYDPRTWFYLPATAFALGIFVLPVYLFRRYSAMSN